MAQVVPVTELDLAILLLARFPNAVKDAVRLVEEAEKRSALVATLERGPEREAELRNWMSDMGMARGAVMTLRTLHNDPEAEELTARLNRCPMIMMGVPVVAELKPRIPESEGGA